MFPNFGTTANQNFTGRGDYGGPWDPAHPLSNEPIEGNSLTQYLRSLMNFLQNQGAGQLFAGQGTTESAISGVGQAGRTLQPGIDYWTRLLSGDQGETVRAMAPEASAINAQYAQANRAAQMLPRGGFASATRASLPFAAARDIGNTALTLRPQAAQGVMAGGQAQGGLAQLLALIGQGQSGLGQGLLGMASQGQLGIRGQDVGEHGQTMSLAGQTADALSRMLAAKIGSDRRIKRDLVSTGLQVLGIPVWWFRYLWSPAWTLGVMAQDLIDVLPDAVYRGPVWRVNYSRLALEVLNG